MGRVTGIQEVNIADLKPYERNAKQHGPEQVKKLCDSIREFGFISPCLIDSGLNIIAGHGRIMAAREMGMEKVPCLFVEGLTETQRKAYILADNRLTELGEWDMDIVNAELMDLDLADFDVSLTGFDFDLPEEQDEIEEDDVPELEEETTVQRGYIYQLGEHRLMCGDSTSLGDVATLMNGQYADMVFTDPPYNMNYCGKGFINEKTKNVKERIKEIIDFDPSGINYLANGVIANNIFIFTSKDLIKQYLTMFDGWSFNLLMWHKTNTPPMVNNNFFADTEYILYFHRGERVWNNKLTPIDIYKKYFVSSIQEGKKNAGSDYHPTIKPLQLVKNEILICSHPGGTVVDIFGGSGTTLIACEQTGRKCCMMELDPHYVDVIIKRWENLTGLKAVLLNG